MALYAKRFSNALRWATSRSKSSLRWRRCSSALLRPSASQLIISPVARKIVSLRAPSGPLNSSP